MQNARREKFLLATVLLGLSSCSNDVAPPGACRVDLDCPGNGLCERGACVVVQDAAAPAGGCQKDLDCKGDRICVNYSCVDPGSPAMPQTDGAPSATVPVDAGGTGAFLDGPGGSANIKFCHQLLVDGVETTLTMAVAGKSLPAITGQCSTCQTIPADVLLDYKVFHPSGESLADFKLALERGDHVFLGTFQNNEPTLRWGKVRAPSTCESADPFTSAP
jgi:hypothetical protein